MTDTSSDGPDHADTPDRTGWLPWRAYLAAIESDGERLVEVASRSLSAPVPSCPGWTSADLLAHTTRVYLHKVACMEAAAPPDPWPPPRPADPDLAHEFRTAHATLLAELVRRDPDERRYTWWPADQTNGFWYRRMALESAVHRVDAELAGAEVTPVPEQLALDGIDEILCIMLAGEDWDDDDNVTGHPVDARIKITSGGRTWTVTASATDVAVSRHDDSSAETEIDGSPHDLFVWLWGRGPIDALSVTGDPANAAELRERLAESD